jgi:hypothetical protein
MQSTAVVWVGNISLANWIVKGFLPAKLKRETVMLRTDFTLTKRHLGLILMAAGLGLVVIMLAAEWLDSQSGGFGTLQKMGVMVGALSLIAGCTLLPLGNRPA